MVIGKLRKTISENREPDKYTGDQTRQDQDISKPMAIKDEIKKENLKLKDMPFKKKAVSAKMNFKTQKKRLLPRSPVMIC